MFQLIYGRKYIDVVIACCIHPLHFSSTMNILILQQLMHLCFLKRQFLESDQLSLDRSCLPFDSFISSCHLLSSTTSVVVFPPTVDKLLVDSTVKVVCLFQGIIDFRIYNSLLLPRNCISKQNIQFLAVTKELQI